MWAGPTSESMTVEQVLEALRRPGPYENPRLADEMDQALLD
jgi:hypothetical protein